MKKDVLAKDGLPPKREVVVYAGMSSLQRSFYELAGKNALREALVRSIYSMLPVLLILFVLCTFAFMLCFFLCLTESVTT